MNAPVTWPVFAWAAAATFAATFLARRIFARVGFVSRPRQGRWSSRTVPLGGGIPLVAGMMLAALSGGAFSGPRLGLLALILGMAVLGAADDVFKLKPYGKLAAEIGGACAAVAAGYRFGFGVPALDWAISVAWIVGLTNAVNLIDNMDGAASGVVCIAGLALSMQQDAGGSILALAMAGACLGFFLHNFKPARIFMGDAGSLALGFALAALSTRLGPAGLPRLIRAGAVAIVPIFDTALVVTARLRAGRPVMVGGRDHTAHRLASLGWGEWGAVLALYLASLAGGTIALGLQAAGSASQ